MDSVKRVAKIIPAGTWPDSGAEETSYWLSRAPAERVAAGRELVRSTYRRMYGRDLPPVVKVARIIKSWNDLE